MKLDSSKLASGLLFRNADIDAHYEEGLTAVSKTIRFKSHSLEQGIFLFIQLSF